MSTTWGSDNVTFDGSSPKKPIENIEEKKEEAIEKEKPVIKHDVLFEHPFLTVKSNKGYAYSERKGVDSVAFILLATNASDERRIGVINEYKPPLERHVVTAFGGSIDHEKYQGNLKKLVIDEALEEAGFVVSEDDIKECGKVFCSSQSNQFVHLFAVEVDKLKQGERTTNDPLELKSSVAWVTVPEAMKLEDWKAPTIIIKRLADKDSYASVKTK